MRNSRAQFLSLVLATMAGAVTACSGTGRTSSTDPASTDEKTGKVDLDLALAQGVTVDTVSYTITGPDAFSKTGSIDVSNSTTLSALIGPLPVGHGFNITLAASSTDASTTCSGTATFDVTAHQTTPVTVHLSCRMAATTGSVLVNGSLNVCPQIDGVTATPNEVLVGASVGLAASAHDSDSGPSPVTYAWTSSAGTFTDAAAPNTRFTCTTPGTATINLGVTDGDGSAGCAATSSVTVTCTARTASNSCELGNGAGAVKHVIYLQFDNTHLTRDRDAVPSDLEQMPNLLNFIRGNGTMMANDHTILISHTAGGILSSLTGNVPGSQRADRDEQLRAHDEHRHVLVPELVRVLDRPDDGREHPETWWVPTARRTPAPWVAYTRAGCDVGAVGAANIVLENTSTASNGGRLQGVRYRYAAVPGGDDVERRVLRLRSARARADRLRRVRRPLRERLRPVRTRRGRLAPGRARRLRRLQGAVRCTADRPGAHRHGHERCRSPTSSGTPSSIPSGSPASPASTACRRQCRSPTSRRCKSTASPSPTPTSPMRTTPRRPRATRTPRTARARPVTCSSSTTTTPRSATSSRASLPTASTSRTRSSSSRSTRAITSRAGTPLRPPATASTRPATGRTRLVGEINANIDTLVQHQFPALYSSFLASTATNTFTVHGDSAPTFYLAKKGMGALGQTDADTRTFERTIAGLTAVNPFTRRDRPGARADGGPDGHEGDPHVHDR